MTFHTSTPRRVRSRALSSTAATKLPGAVPVPFDLDHAAHLAGGQGGGVGAVAAVHADAPAPGDEADDLVARHRRAAPRQPHHDVVEALDVDTDALALVDPAGLAGRGRQLHLVVAAAQLPGHPLGDGLGRHVALADGRVEGVEVGVVHGLGHA